MAVPLRRFGIDFRFTLITRNPALAQRGDAAGIDRIGIDIERLGKAARQSGLESARISEHELSDLRRLAPAVRHAALFARLNVLPTIITVIVLVSSPGAKVRLPFAERKSLPATAVPGSVAQLTVTVCDDGADKVTVNVIGVHGLQPVAAGATLLFAIDRPGVPDDTVRATTVPGGTVAPAAGD